jgi:hypothetical protein
MQWEKDRKADAGQAMDECRDPKAVAAVRGAGADWGFA